VPPITFVCLSGLWSRSSARYIATRSCISRKGVSLPKQARSGPRRSSARTTAVPGTVLPIRLLLGDLDGRSVERRERRTPDMDQQKGGLRETRSDAPEPVRVRLLVGIGPDVEGERLAVAGSMLDKGRANSCTLALVLSIRKPGNGLDQASTSRTICSSRSNENGLGKK
jgi:hypothetical protein